jgi:hypothetical protein
MSSAREQRNQKISMQIAKVKFDSTTQNAQPLRTKLNPGNHLRDIRDHVATWRPRSRLISIGNAQYTEIDSADLRILCSVAFRLRNWRHSPDIFDRLKYLTVPN